MSGGKKDKLEPTVGGAALMFIVQNQFCPGTMLSGLLDMMHGGVVSLRICCAYVSMSGSQMLFDGIARSAANGNPATVDKTIVASLDFGLTEPDALRFWRDMDNSRVLVAGAPHLEDGRLTTYAAFHPKLYILGRQDGTVGSLVGSANLTNRGLTVNAEAGWLEMEHHAPESVDGAWNAAIGPAVDMTPEILDRYSAVRQRIPGEQWGEEMEPVPALQIGQVGGYRLMADAGIDPSSYDQMWVHAHRLSGGARTQLELPRGSHRFFGPAYEGYDYERVEHIAEPSLVSGQRMWLNRPVTWHGDNRMERINLPSAAMGGYAYENSLILFRRMEPNAFELRVYPWESDAARSYVEASRLAGLVFRVGGRSPRFAGLLA